MIIDVEIKETPSSRGAACGARANGHAAPMELNRSILIGPINMSRRWRFELARHSENHFDISQGLVGVQRSKGNGCFLLLAWVGSGNVTSGFPFTNRSTTSSPCMKE